MKPSFRSKFGIAQVRRLLRLARFVETSRTFDMGAFFQVNPDANTCGTPACVAGHGLILFRKPLERVNPRAAESVDTALLAEYLTGRDRRRNYGVYNVLFNSINGCNGASTGRQAATYIREVFIPALKKGRLPRPRRAVE